MNILGIVKTEILNTYILNTIRIFEQKIENIVLLKSIS